MRITVLGSWRESKTPVHQGYWGLRKGDEFESACVQLGEELARTARSVIVCDDSSNSADRHVVSGILKVARSRPPVAPLIRVIPNGSKYPFEELAREHDRLFATEPVQARNVADARLIAVRMSDVVLIVGGTESTYEGALISLINRKRLVPVGSFGGRLLV